MKPEKLVLVLLVLPSCLSYQPSQLPDTSDQQGHGRQPRVRISLHGIGCRDQGPQDPSSIGRLVLTTVVAPTAVPWVAKGVCTSWFARGSAALLPAVVWSLESGGAYRYFDFAHTVLDLSWSLLNAEGRRLAESF